MILELYKFELQADFDYDIIRGVVVIYEAYSNKKASVTNAIEWVLKEIKRDINNFHNKKVIYKDSQGIFDGVSVDVEGNFKEFYSLNEMDLDRALLKAKARV